jgi:hypothetical protein
VRTEAEIQADAKDRRPFSNGTEGYAWMDNWCYRCVHNDEEREIWCPLLTVALLGKTPAEWIDQTADGHRLGDTYRCTEFEERRDDDGPGDDPEPEPEPTPVDENQLDLIDAYLDTAIDQLSKAPEVHRVG